MNQEERDKLLLETHDSVNTLQTVLLGADGDGGLVESVKDLGKSHYRLKQHFWILIGILVGSGVLAGGISLLLP